MKTLIIVTHPNLEKSKINKRWIEELNKSPEKYIVHDLHKAYPDWNIDVGREHKLLESVDKVVLQFPFYWFNCPPLLKKWLDDVLSHGWAYGKNSGYRLEGKKVTLAVTAGIKDEDYKKDARYRYTLEELTSPFEISFLYVKADYLPLYAFYGAEHDPTDEHISRSAQAYMQFIDNL